ncbi:MAG: hypothetical protein IMF18_03385 [Proteobacteria bacterium]|nr:hypothetical protein [Pseudomonadota bacterium]
MDLLHLASKTTKKGDRIMCRKIFLPKLFLLVTLTVCLVFCWDGHAEQEPFVVTVTHPQNGNEVGTELTVKGTASIPLGNYLWVLARRVDFEPLWWPQREAKIDPKTHKWSATATFGLPRDINWDFDIGVITVDANGHQELMDYWIEAMKTGDWRPIQIPATTSPPRIIRVKKVRH